MYDFFKKIIPECKLIVSLSNLENVLQTNLKKYRAKECIFRVSGDTNLEDFTASHQPWWVPFV